MEPKTEEQSAKALEFEKNKLLENVDFDVYCKADGINSHGLMDVLRSPAHYYEHRYNRVHEKDTDSLLYGRLFHLAILEPVLFRERCMIEPVFTGKTLKGEWSEQSKEAKEKKKAWHADLPQGTIVVPSKWVDPLTRMANKILAHPRARKLLEEGVRETTMFWNDTDTGELCKMRPDFVTAKGDMIDLKTAKDARDHKFRKQIENYRYDLQAAHYLAGARATGVCRSDSFTFLVIEKDPPYEIAIYPAGASVLGVGDQWRTKAMKTFVECTKSGRWPGYNPNARVIEHSHWAEIPDDDEDDE